MRDEIVPGVWLEPVDDKHQRIGGPFDGSWTDKLEPQIVRSLISKAASLYAPDANGRLVFIKSGSEDELANEFQSRFPPCSQ